MKSEIRFHWWESTMEEQYIEQQVHNLILALQQRGAQFYSYCAQQILYIDGHVIDMFRKSAVIELLKQLNLADMPYLRDVVELLRWFARPLYQPIPEGKLGQVNGVKEPKLRMTRYLHACVAEWIKEVIESRKLSQS